VTDHRSDVAPYPRALAHVGVGVTDLDGAISWYEEVLGLRLILGPVEIAVDGSPGGEAAADVFGPSFQRLRQAHMACGNGVALELFEFVDPVAQSRRENFQYWTTGYSHVCFIDPDVEGLAGRIARAGGRVRTTRAWPVFAEEEYRFCFCEDPFGNVLELYSHSHEQTYSNRSDGSRGGAARRSLQT
jgi:catechol 2,3-dioxygenase-like lactoylglutathione lyase family enzyme